METVCGDPEGCAGLFQQTSDFTLQVRQRDCLAEASLQAEMRRFQQQQQSRSPRSCSCSNIHRRRFLPLGAVVLAMIFFPRGELCNFALAGVSGRAVQLDKRARGTRSRLARLSAEEPDPGLFRNDTDLDELPDASAEFRRRYSLIQEALERGREKGESPDAVIGSEEDFMQLIAEAQLRGQRKQGLTPTSAEEDEDDLTGTVSLDDFLARDLRDRAKEMQVSVQSDVAAIRMRRTLEFCPDGVLARKLLGEMLAEGRVPSAAAYDLVLEALGSRGNINDALDLFREMQDAGVAATDRTYDALSRPASRSGEWRFVEKVYKAKAKNQPPDEDMGATSLAILLDAYANGVPPQREMAEELFHDQMAKTWDNDKQRSPLATPKVVASLRRAVGLTTFRILCRKYSLDSIEERDRPEGADDFC
mmetsp:Transcript_42850/g.100479  ORF Transcript_42850/g.100479 Transcript_42850/m.100479 type:complete len:420 (-) Transcript_42850:78-1337(-)